MEIVGRERGVVGIFRETNVPRHHAKSPINERGRWYTWSRRFRKLAGEWAQYVAQLPPPKLVRIAELRSSEYDQTYSLPLRRILKMQLRAEIQVAARQLHTMEVTNRIMLMNDLLGDRLSGRALHYLFAALREGLVGIVKDATHAMHQPLRTGPHEREFPLHADLYVPHVLFNVFDNVSSDGSGASVFLSVRTLGRLTASVDCMPPDARRKLASFFSDESRSDRFTRAYNLMHGEHPWTEELEEGMAKYQLIVGFRAGEGYLLHDRRWLHGRTAPTSGIPKNRVHRLVYSPKP